MADLTSYLRQLAKRRKSSVQPPTDSLREKGLLTRARDCIGSGCSVIDSPPDWANDQALAVGALMPDDQEHEVECLAPYGLHPICLCRDGDPRDLSGFEPIPAVHVNRHGIWLGSRAKGGAYLKCKLLLRLEERQLYGVAEYLGVSITWVSGPPRALRIACLGTGHTVHYHTRSSGPVQMLGCVLLTPDGPNRWIVNESR